MCRNTAEYKGRKTTDFTKMTMQRIFGCAILNIRETALQATQSSQDRRDELDVCLAVPSAQSACEMEIRMKTGREKTKWSWKRYRNIFL